MGSTDVEAVDELAGVDHLVELLERLLAVEASALIECQMRKAPSPWNSHSDASS